jgi:hypothetical protein
MGEREVAVLSFLTRDTAAGLLLLLLRVSSGLRHTLSELVSHMLGVLLLKPNLQGEEACSSLKHTAVNTLRCRSCLRGRYDRSELQI